MENIHIMLQQKLQELKILENERAELIKEFNNATDANFAEVVKKMKQSEQKFKALAEDTKALAEKLKQH